MANRAVAVNVETQPNAVERGGGVSTPVADCSGHGVIRINTTNDCHCDEGWATHVENASANMTVQCSYRRKNGVSALLLQLFLWYGGAMRFYLGYTALGSVQVVLVVLSCLGCCCLRIQLESRDPNPVMLAIICPFCLGAMAALIWAVVDLVWIATGSLPDANGVPLKPL